MRRTSRLWWALGLNLLIVVAQVIAGVAADSLGLIADAGHNLSDVAALVVSLVAIRLAARPATPQRSFGFHRATILGAQANAAMLLVVTIIVAIEGVRRLLDPEPVAGGVVLVVAAIATVVNGASAMVLARDHGHDLNMRSAVLHMVSDTAASVGVLLAGAVILVSGGMYWLDPAVSLVISALVGWRAWRLLAETADVLLESTPEGLDADELVVAMRGVDGVADVHDLHVWTLSSDLRALAAHLVITGTPTLEEAQRIGGRVKALLLEDWAIEHATLELECGPCVGDEECSVTLASVTGHRH